MPKVSVVILNYNQAPYLRKRIDSILQQTYQNYQLTILDDCSTDESWNIILEYHKKHTSITIKRNERNSGSPFSQWYEIINNCNTEYLWIAEGDDFAEKEFLAKTVSFMDENPTACLVEVNSNYVGIAGQIIGTTAVHKLKAFPEIDWSKKFCLEGNDYYRKALCYGNSIVNASAVLFRTSSIIKHTALLKEYYFVGDWKLYIKLSKSYYLGYVPELLSNFRLHDYNQTSQGYSNRKAKEEYFSLVDYCIRDIDRLPVNALVYIKKMNRCISIFGITLKDKFRLMRFYLKTNPRLTITGLYFNLISRIF